MRRLVSCLLSGALSFSLIGFFPVAALAEEPEENMVENDELGLSPDVDLGNDGLADLGEDENVLSSGADNAAASATEDGEDKDDQQPPDGEEKTETVTTAPVLAAKVHVQNIGNMAEQSIKLGERKRLGTSGRALRLESFAIRVSSPGTIKTVTTHQDGTVTESASRKLSGDIVYSAHVQNIGWQKEVKNGSAAGTSGRSLRVEAVKIRLTGELANYFDVRYRVHVQNIGDLGWTKAGGSEAGTTGASLRVESIDIELVKKGAPSADSTPSAVPQASMGYRVHIQNIGDQGGRSWGAVAGTTGRSLRLENIRITAPSNTGMTGGVEYRSHVQNIGWQDWVANGAESGTHGRSLRMEAVSIKLTGELSKYYNVYYRVHVQNLGWLGWAKNGQDAGTIGYSYRLEAIQIRLEAKGAAAPGQANNCFVDGANLNTTQRAMLNRLNRYPSRTNYAIGVDTVACRVGVFQKINGAWRPVKWFVCAPGLPNSPTRKGVFEVQSRGYSFGSGFTCYYWTQFSGNYLFHSIKYRQGTRTVMDGTLGRPASHGCVRLDISEAKWIYDNIPRGTRVVSY